MDPWWYPIGFVAVVFGCKHLETARQGRRGQLMNLLPPLVAGYFAVRHPGFYEQGGAARLSWLALAFCALSPVIGYLWWGRSGAIRRRIGKLLLFLLLSAVSFVFWSLFRPDPGQAALLAVLTALLPFLPVKRFLRRWRWRRQAAAQRREQEQAARLKKEEWERKERELAAAQRRQQQAEAAVAAGKKTIAKLRRGEERHRQKRQRRRQEVIEQIKLIREAEVERVRQGDSGLHFHADYGFLMAEAWRVLRAQLARGERVPAQENDGFLLQVVEELLHDQDFPSRYFHRKGQKAITATNRYLAGQVPLAEAVKRIRRLRFTPTELAPEPLTGKGLPEAWLVPHRRRQDAEWEEFQRGRHPWQVQIMTAWSRKGAGLPSREQWRQLWDQEPALFLHSHTGGAVPPQKAARWRTLVLSISRRDKAR